MTNDWLQQLKAGDTVIVDSHYDRLSVGTVERVTATQIILAGRAWRFRRSDGFAVGRASYDLTMLREPTPKMLEQATRRDLLEQIKDTRWSGLPTATLTQIVELVRKAKEEAKP